MSNHNRLLPVVAVTGSTILVGCHGSGGSCGSYGSSSYGSYGPCSAPPTITPGGVYEGTSSNGSTQNPVIAIITESGDGRMSGQDGTYYRLNVGNRGTSVSGSFAGYSQGASFPNGAQAIAGSVSGDLTPALFNATLTENTGGSLVLLLNFDNVYNLVPSLATLAGTWTYAVAGFSFTATIRADGSFSAIDSSNCSYSGAFSLTDPNFNAYSENYVRSCGATNVTFDGLSSFFPASSSGANVTKAHIQFLADDHASEYLAIDLQ